MDEYGSSSESSPSRNSSNQEDDSSNISHLSSSSNDDSYLLNYDPTPWDNPYPQPSWFSCKQFMNREYGRNLRPGLLNKRPRLTPYSPYWFRKYAYNSLYFIQKMEVSDILSHHTGCVNCLNFNETGNLLCSGSDDLFVNIWDWQNSKVKHSFSTGHKSNVFQTRWCLKDSHIVTSARDGQIRICDVNNSGCSKNIAQHSGSVHRLTFSEPNIVLSCGEDAIVNLIDLRCPEVERLMILKNHNNHSIPLYTIHCNMTFSPFHFAVAGKSTRVFIFDRRYISQNYHDDYSSDSSSTNESSPMNGTNHETSPKPLLEISPNLTRDSVQGTFVTCAVYNSSGTKLLVSYNDDDLFVFDVKTGKQEAKFQGHRNRSTIKGCFWFEDDFVLSGSDDGYIYGWDLKSQHIVMSVQADNSGAVNCIEMHPCLPVFASGGIADSVKVWEPKSEVWPKTLTQIKRRICSNMRDRSCGFEKSSMHSGNPIFWLVLRHMRQRIRNSQRDDDSDSQDENENSADDSCHVS